MLWEQGECAASGQFVCADDGDGVRCDIDPRPTEEMSGLDNDCDGLFDETFEGLNARCEVGLGRCERRDWQICAEDQSGVICSATPAPPNVETCNQIDDDCDGRTDEAFPELGDACADGIGACRREGQLVCSQTRKVTCSIEAGQPVEEICDTFDNDCDGQADEAIHQNVSSPYNWSRSVIMGRAFSGRSGNTSGGTWVDHLLVSQRDGIARGRRTGVRPHNRRASTMLGPGRCAAGLTSASSEGSAWGAMAMYVP